MELDRISSLPNDVTEKILSRLPLREAVRTRVLSSKWRYKSEMLQDLVLTINRNFLKYLFIGALPEKLPKPCQYMNFLSVNISFDDSDEISTVLCLLSSSPALRELEILVDPEKGHAAMGEVKSCLYDNYDCTHTQLRLVKITKISCMVFQSY
ncbi:putative F-box domain-containing protein [Rosa chinensis]|uniref:Putative F-box domain-containing protein n=1 Tax=Rosa chinensis TaxID=74649 RepID=A0A2P6PK43_ROSCH|nr:putative F-box domain-containing protein [Rosa chinensis]